MSTTSSRTPAQVPAARRQPLPDEGAVGALVGDDPRVRRVVDVEQLAVADRGAIDQAIVDRLAHLAVRRRVERVVLLRQRHAEVDPGHRVALQQPDVDVHEQVARVAGRQVRLVGQEALRCAAGRRPAPRHRGDHFSTRSRAASTTYRLKISSGGRCCSAARRWLRPPISSSPGSAQRLRRLLAAGRSATPAAGGRPAPRRWRRWRAATGRRRPARRSPGRRGRRPCAPTAAVDPDHAAAAAVRDPQRAVAGGHHGDGATPGNGVARSTSVLASPMRATA